MALKQEKQLYFSLPFIAVYASNYSKHIKHKMATLISVWFIMFTTHQRHDSFIQWYTQESYTCYITSSTLG